MPQTEALLLDGKRHCCWFSTQRCNDDSLLACFACACQQCNWQHKRLHSWVVCRAPCLALCCRWLRPYQNGTLPNAKVRDELAELLGVLQLDTTNDYVRERLEESELGKIIMFYYKNPNEGSECRAC